VCEVGFQTNRINATVKDTKSRETVGNKNSRYLKDKINDIKNNSVYRHNTHTVPPHTFSFLKIMFSSILILGFSFRVETYNSAPADMHLLTHLVAHMDCFPQYSD
jgi:hypothetical protein